MIKTMLVGVKQRIGQALRVVSLALLIGSGLYLYNDFQDTRIRAAEQDAISIQEPEDATGIVEIGPDGIREKPDKSKNPQQ